MKADAFEIGAILRQRQRFVVPVYQRHYAWAEDRLEAFWEDVRTKADERLEGKPHRFAHYMGALLVMPDGGYQVGRVPSFAVVDGQQRLTTFHLFLAALRDIAREWELDGMAAELGAHLVNGDEKLMQDPANERYKLQPTKYDRVLYRRLVDLPLSEIQSLYADHFFQNGNLRKGETPLPLRAWWYFREHAVAFAGEDGDEFPVRAARLEELWKALLAEFRLVVITLDEGDDAQVIFETLNSRGEPLLAMDLVRNDVFHRAAALDENAEELFETKWETFENAFWSEQARQGRLNKPRIDFYLGHTLAAETGREVTLTKLYSEYRAFTRPKRGEKRFATVSEELDLLTRYAPVYRALVEDGGPPRLAWLARRLRIWDVSTFYPLVFRIEADEAASGSEKRTLYELVHAYVVRRALCGLTPKNYNKTALRVVTHFAEHGVSVKSFADAFSGQKGDAVRFPDDAELRQNILARPLYGSMPGERIRFVLEELERVSRDKFDENVGLPVDLSIEHILPDAWRAHWPLPNGQHAPVDPFAPIDDEMRLAVDRREGLKHTLGNLTLLTRAANPSLSNSAFAEPLGAGKRELLRSSLLKLNQEVASRSTWDEDAILWRGDLLASRAAKLWPNPSATVAALAAALGAAE